MQIKILSKTRTQKCWLKGRRVCFTTFPNVRESKTVLKYLSLRTWILDSIATRFRFEPAIFLILKPMVADSASKNFPDSGIQIPLNGAKYSLSTVRCNVEQIKLGRDRGSVLKLQYDLITYTIIAYRGFWYRKKLSIFFSFGKLWTHQGIKCWKIFSTI